MPDVDSFRVDLVFEALGRATFLPTTDQITFFAMAGFGGYDLMRAAFYSMIGSVIGSLFNWALGWGVGYIRSHHAELMSDALYHELRARARFGAILLLPFFWIPFGNIMTLVAGFFHLRWWQVAGLVAFGAYARLYYFYI